MNTVGDLGEFGLIERLTRTLGPQRPDDIVVDLGDDAAVVRFGDELLAWTTDTMVEGVHFTAENADWAALGWKAMGSNLSDIAAMGAWPRFALVTLAMPPGTDMHNMDRLFGGIRDSGKLCAVHIVGGDTVRASELSITITVIGRAQQDDDGHPLVLRRDAAQPGDVIAVTGTLGDSAGGLRRLQVGADTRDHLVSRHLMVHARLAEGNVAAGVGVRCGIDVSDGLLQDVGHICERSKAGAIIRGDAIPMSGELLEAYPEDALQLACTGGEDYELVLVGSEDAITTVNRELDGSVTIIGEIVDDKQKRVRLLSGTGEEIRFPRAGWDAFK